MLSRVSHKFCTRTPASKRTKQAVRVVEAENGQDERAFAALGFNVRLGLCSGMSLPDDRGGNEPGIH